MAEHQDERCETGMGEDSDDDNLGKLAHCRVRTTVARVVVQRGGFFNNGTYAVYARASYGLHHTMRRSPQCVHTDDECISMLRSVALSYF